MKPRSLRHRLEKIAKLLVIVQKHAPDVNCVIDVDKGDYGYVVIDFTDSGMIRDKMNALGKDLESKGYSFTEKNCPWLGQINYTGRSGDKPIVVFTLPITKNRLAINEEALAEIYRFTS
jgi:hypothetical protein